MNKSSVRWIRCPILPLAFMPALFLGGCLSPKMMEPVARQNQVNIANYTVNVDKVVATLLEEDALLRGIMLHYAQENVTRALINLRGKILAPDPVAADDSSQAYYTELHDGAEEVKKFLQIVDNDEARIALAKSHPLTYDIAVGTPGFSIQSVIKDSFALKDLNQSIRAASNPVIARVYQAKRAQLVAPYFIIQKQVSLDEIYQKALSDFLETLKDQAAISQSHAQAFIGYAQAQPALDSLKSIGQDEDLRQSVLGLVAKRKGQATADELKSHLTRADQIIAILDTK